MYRYLKPLLMLYAILGLTVKPAIAASTEWQDLGGGKARLSAVLDPSTNEISAMVEIKLDEGWKTYWREPGGSGIPPQFDFSSSKHFLPGEVLFPTPQRLEASGAVFAGYKGTVRFPFRGQMTGQGNNGSIHLNLLAGVCEEICIPAIAQFEIPFSALLSSDPESQLGIGEAFKKVPEEPGGDFKILGVSEDGEDRLTVEVKIPEGEPEPALFAEGPYGWYLPPAEHVSTKDGRAIFSVDIQDIPEGASPAETKLRYTVVQGDRGIEQWVSADK
ncbi:MAG: protein-disulfide reductase DsbD domain-containing protein [Rhizobiaceae bacterium]